MLKPVIQKKNIHAVLLHLQALRVALCSNAKQNALLQPEFHQLNLVARPVAALVATRQYPHTFALSEQPFRKPDNHRRFARAAYREIPHTDYRAIQPLWLENALRVEPHTKPG